MGIRGVDAEGGPNLGDGAGGGLCLGVWRTVLWYQGRSRVVSECYQGGKGWKVSFSVLRMLMQATPTRASCDPQARGHGGGMRPKPVVGRARCLHRTASVRRTGAGLGVPPRRGADTTLLKLPSNQPGTKAVPRWHEGVAAASPGCHCGVPSLVRRRRFSQKSGGRGTHLLTLR
jgi:hypothetical protein